MYVRYFIPLIDSGAWLRLFWHQLVQMRQILFMGRLRGIFWIVMAGLSVYYSNMCGYHQPFFLELSATASLLHPILSHYLMRLTFPVKLTFGLGTQDEGSWSRVVNCYETFTKICVWNAIVYMYYILKNRFVGKHVQCRHYYISLWCT